MQVIVVTGHSSSSVEIGWDVAQSLGVKAAAPGPNETDDPPVFHHKLFRARKIGPADEAGQIKPGRMWHRLGENLLLNNVESDAWGWASLESSRLLDFWASIDQSIHFVLLYAAPELSLARSLAAKGEVAEDLNDRLASWRLKNSELLDFYSRNRDRSLLLNTYSLIRTPHRLGELLTDRFGLDLPDANAANISAVDYPVSAMRAFLARTRLDDSDAIALYEELETASDLPAESGHDRYEAERAWSEYRQLLESQAELHAKTGDLQKELAKARQTGEEQTKENELLLLQLHQVQEELENYYLRAQETENKVHQKAQALKAMEDRAKDNEKKLEQLQDDLDKTQRERDAARTQLRAAESAKQAQSNLQDRVTKLQKELSTAHNNLEEQTKENELLLLQLHQVQEELENYYLKYREAQDALQNTSETADSAPSQNKKANGKNGHDTLTDERGFVRAYLNKKKTAKKLKRKIALIRRSNLFDEQWYLKEYPDVARSGMDPVRHYIKFGVEEGRDPSLAFGTRYYQYNNPDVSDAAINPLIHYISHGKEEGRRARP